MDNAVACKKHDHEGETRNAESNKTEIPKLWNMDTTNQWWKLVLK